MAERRTAPTTGRSLHLVEDLLASLRWTGGPDGRLGHASIDGTMET
jgi:hypothetical protein